MAQPTPKVSFDSSETLFTVLSAINTCGYNDGLDASRFLFQLGDTCLQLLDETSELVRSHNASLGSGVRWGRGVGYHDDVPSV